MTTITTRHGLLTIHAGWLDHPDTITRRWLRAGTPKAPTWGPMVLDYRRTPATLVPPPGIDRDGVRIAIRIAA